MASINVTVHKIDGLFTGGCQKGIDCSKVKSIGVKTIQLPHQPVTPDCALPCQVIPVQEGVLYTFFNAFAFFNGVDDEFVLFDISIYNQVKAWLLSGNIMVVGGATVIIDIINGVVPSMIITPGGVSYFDDLNQSIHFITGQGSVNTCDGQTYTTQFPGFMPDGYVFGFTKEQEVDNTLIEVQVEVIEYNGQTWYIGYNGTSIIKQCVNNAFANNRTIQDFTFDCNTGDIAITFVNGTNITRNLKCLLPEIVDIVNIGAGNPNPLQPNTIQVKNTGEVFFVDKDGDIQQIEFINNTASGLYQPNIINQENATDVDISEIQFIKVGDVVTFSGRIGFNVVDFNNVVKVDFSLPIPTLLNSSYQLSGTAIAIQPGNFQSNFIVNPTSDLSNGQVYGYHYISDKADIWFTATYKINKVTPPV